MTLPNERLEGFGVRLPCVVPLPETGIVRLGFEPLDVMVTFPLIAPAFAGANATVNDALCPEFSVRGSDSPPTLNPAPLADAEEIVTLVPPLFVRVTD